MRFTTANPVSGKVHFCTSFASPSLVQCWVMTKIDFTPATRSMAPPTAGRSSGSPVGQIAVLRDLERAEDAKIQVAAAAHGEAVRVMKVGGARQRRRALFARIDPL